MKAVVLSQAGAGGRTAELADLEIPVLQEGGLLVEMKACGLCGTDIEKVRGEYTASQPVIGHEAVGVVSQVGRGVKGFRAGDRVFPHHHVPDNTCYLCRAGSETMCARYRSSNLAPGGFSEYFLVPKWNVEGGGVLRLPDAMPFDVGALIEPLACCVRSIRRSGFRGGESVLVAGAGPVGMMHALLLRDAGARVIVSDVAPERLAFAEKASTGKVLDAREDVPRSVVSETDGRGADLAIVASGSKGAILQGLRSVRKGGRVVLFGVPPIGTVLDYDVSELYNSEREILTTYGAAEADTKEALKILEARGAELGSLITHRLALEEFDEAMEVAAGGSAMKVVIVP